MHPTQDISKLEQEVSRILRERGSQLGTVWQETHHVSLKDLREPVTEFDVRLEKEIRADLAALLPEAGFIVEEGENTEEREYSWIIDPIDQTKNFIGQIPVFYTQVALVHLGVPILGLIYNPVSGQLFSASTGNGTKLNGVRAQPVVKTILKEALVDIDFGGSVDVEGLKMPIVSALATSAYRIRMSGGAFAPHLVTGGIDALVVLNQKVKLVDQLPRMILATELGLRFEPIELNGFSVFVAASHAVFDEIERVIRSALPQ